MIRDPGVRRRYAVMGNPIGHSRSPVIHAAFAAQLHERIEYGALLVPPDGFRAAVARFRAEGGGGLNLTLPFKEQGFAWVREQGGELTSRAVAAAAVNTLRFDGDALLGDNTDGAGFVQDLQQRHGFPLSAARVLLLGAGGAARGVAPALLEQGVAALWIANRTQRRAQELVARFSDPRVRALGWDEMGEVEPTLVVHATSATIAGGVLALPAAAFGARPVCYDLSYARRSTAFLEQARRAGSRRCFDGLGMLVEQAAESFLVWRGLRPETEAVYRAQREQLDAA